MESILFLSDMFASIDQDSGSRRPQRIRLVDSAQLTMAKCVTAGSPLRDPVDEVPFLFGKP